MERDSSTSATTQAGQAKSNRSKRSSGAPTSATSKGSVASRSGSTSSAQSKVRSTEVKNLVDKIKQLAPEFQGGRSQETHSEQLRNCSTKLLNAVKGQAALRHILNSDPAVNLVFVPAILKNCSDVIVIQNVVKLVLDCCNAKAGNSRLPTFQVLLEWDVVSLVYECLDWLRLSRHVSDSAVSWLHQLLVEVGARDGQFAAKARKNGIKLSCLAVKNVNFEAKNFVPVLKVFKMYSRVGNTCRTVLSREQAVSLLMQSLNVDGKRPPLHATLILESLSNMCKQKTLCQEAVKCGLAASALKILRSWLFVDTSEQIKLCRATLSALCRVASFGFGVTPIKKAGGMDVVEKFLAACPSSPPSFDPLLSKAAELYHFIVVKKPLPVPSARGPFKFVDKRTVLSYMDEADSKSSDALRTAAEAESSSGSELEPASDASDLGRESRDGAAALANTRPSSVFLLVAANTFQRGSPELAVFSDFFPEVSSREARLIEPEALPCRWGVDAVSGARRQAMIRFREKAGYTFDLGELDLPKNDGFAKLAGSSHVHFPLESKASRQGLDNVEAKLALKQAYPDAPPKRLVGDRATTAAGDLLPLARYAEEASKVRSVVPFVKFAYPDFCSDVPASSLPLERLYDKDRVVCREKLVTVVKRMSGETWKPILVYDLDALGLEQFPDLDPEDLTPIRERDIANCDEELILSGAPNIAPAAGDKPLAFESRFECGNLRRAVQVGPREYDLFVSPDLGTSDHHLWFYFQVSNMAPGVAYTFNVASCEKSNCQFNFGMKPVMFSVAESVASQAGGSQSNYTWERVGTNICYYSNQYGGLGGKKSQTGSSGYRSASFTIHFPHASDICYIAYHYPYTYTALRVRE